MKKGKQQLSFLLAIIMVFMLFQLSAFAETTPEETTVDPRTFWNGTTEENISFEKIIEMFQNTKNNDSDDNVDPRTFWIGTIDDISFADFLKMILDLSENRNVANQVLNGDVDGDGQISSADARLALRMSVGLEDFSKDSVAFIAADIDKNGEIDASDARSILRSAVGIEKL